MAELTGRVYDIQPFSVHDGPGIRTTVFLKGCPLRCPWCHSPESQLFEPQLSWIAMRCVGTEQCKDKCIKACPKNAIEYGETRKDMNEDGTVKSIVQQIHVKRDLCDNCGKCAELCYPKALYICGEDYTVDALVKKAMKDKAYFDSSGGGVTISGGEPLSQMPFTLEVLKKLKENGVHTALDTTFFTPWENVEAVLPYVDVFLLDLKHMDYDKHLGMVKVPNDVIHENARKAAKAGARFEIRVPIIPMFNDNDENMNATAKFCKEELGDEAVEFVQLLPYHALGVTKHLRISDTPVAAAVPPSAEKMEHMREITESYGLKVVIY
ncbi:MAG: glycyl-radical enzyme activating protein [Eubacterium sp.]|nr:glycyl-radical enzyme activating protein [Eubacterium sp.]